MKVNLQQYLLIFDENYGTDRNIKKDLGGYAVIVESEEDVQKLNKDVIKGVIPEDVEEIQCGEGQVYCYSLFILSCDYAVVVIATKELTDLLLEGNLSE